ncbi:molybdopterin-dependent oxidoreductase [Streptomyces sp. OF3]|uniref:Molybdopterin-dependent oxidoreductase n=1 Tax=Streptomyces alkaliterrae TaxID=2213162 RepID=A0A7W3ZMC8_9ACTN|nr:molybdopterin-dependent oxidoreductase [Streptomyces alkaliterrae]
MANPLGGRPRISGVRTDRATATRAALGAVSGLLAGCAALAVAELVAALVRPAASPLTAIGGAAVDRTPAPVKDWAIRTFGEQDKAVLQLGMLLTIALFAALLGVLATRRRRTACVVMALFGAVGAVAALGRPDAAGPADASPSLIAGLVAAAVLFVLAGKSTSVAAASAEGGSGLSGWWSRRGFLSAASLTAVAATGAGGLGRALTGARGREAAASREAVRLPAPASPARDVPRGARLRVPGISEYTTPNADFYRVDTALVVPKVDADSWRLRVHGRGITGTRVHTFAELLARPLIERDITLTCVSNEVGGPYVGNARWLGVPLADLLAEAGVRPPSRGGPADQLVARSVDGMTLGTPVEDVMDGRDAMLAVGMNGEPLPFRHGFPVRMLVPGLYGYVSACKWIESIELTTFAAYDPYWVKRKWARRAPIKTQARIDTPKPFARVPAGTVTVAGVAWAQRRGVRRVEVRVDEGPWREADLAVENTVDTWRQWSYRWPAEQGGHTITVRATDGTGRVQTEKRARPIPNGASGWHNVFVTVE